MDKRLSFFFVFLFVILHLFCGSRQTWQKATFIYFDTVCEAELLCSSEEFKAAQDEIRRLFSRVERQFSPGFSDLSSPMILQLFEDAERIYHDSEGSFDITVGPLTRVWGFWDKSFHLPSQEEINTCLKSVGMDKVRKTEDSLFLPPDYDLDWGGIAKGHGIDLVYDALLSLDIKRGFLNSGGDLICWGKNPKNTEWQVGVKHPRKSGYLGVLSISDVAAATTGDYQRYFVIEGIRYHHVLDPHTGYPSRDKQSITVIGPKATLCDALSTALFVSKNTEKILKKYPDYGAVIVDKEGKISILGKSYPFRIL